MVKRDTAAVAAGVTATLGAGGLLTELGPWYVALRKPPWQPPGWLFGPAWTTIGVLTGLALRTSWRSAGADPGRRRRVLLLGGLNGMLNALWSLFFFARRRPDQALVEVVPLWGSIAAMVLFLPRGPDEDVRSARSTRLLLPYLAWVSFAAVLNAEIVRLNRPFGSAERSEHSLPQPGAPGRTLRLKARAAL